MEELYEAWDFQRKFGGSTRTAAEPADAVDGEKPPQFKSFVPGKTRVPKRVTAPAELAPNSHRCILARRLHAAPRLLFVLSLLMSAVKACLLMMPRLGLHSLHLLNSFMMGVFLLQPQHSRLHARSC